MCSNHSFRPFAIETASRSDLARILQLQKTAYLSEAEIYGDFNIPPLLQTLEDLEAEFDTMLFLKIESDGSLVGSVRACEKDGVCHIGKLIVSPEHQNNGLGTSLLLEMERRFPHVSAYALFTGGKSSKNLGLYDKLGYVRTECTRVSDALTIVHLRKPNRPRRPEEHDEETPGTRSGRRRNR